MYRMALSLVLAVTGCSKSSSGDKAGTSEQSPAQAMAEASEDPPTVAEPFTMPAAAQAVARARYVADVEAIARPRPPGSAHWQAVQDMCAERLTSLGFEIERHAYGTGTNIIGKLPGTLTSPDGAHGSGQVTDSWVILSAHYDSTDDTCPGADDNASGVAGLLESARVLAASSHRRTLIAACWDQEEHGKHGSSAYAQRLASAGQSIAMMYDYEMIGYTSDKPDSQKLPTGFDLIYPKIVEQLEKSGRRGDFIALIYDDNPGPRRAAAILQRAASSLDLPAFAMAVPDTIKNSAMTRSLRRSDHEAFWARNMPAMMLTDTANFRNPNYHCLGGTDSVDQLDHDFAVRVIKATVASAAAMLAGQ